MYITADTLFSISLGWYIGDMMIRYLPGIIGNLVYTVLYHLLLV